MDGKENLNIPEMTLVNDIRNYFIILVNVKELDIDTWARKEHFNFFKDFEEPFFGLTIRIDCTKAHAKCKEEGDSFFLYYLYQSLRAANEVEPFRYRMREGKVWVFDQVNASATINRADGTFGFSYIHYHQDYTTFKQSALAEIERTKNSRKLTPSVSGDNVIHFSAVPWIDFTALSHARRFSAQDSCPKISVGKMTEQDGRKGMPVSIHGHHALMDGFHVGQHIERFQSLMDQA